MKEKLLHFVEALPRVRTEIYGRNFADSCICREGSKPELQIETYEAAAGGSPNPEG